MKVCGHSACNCRIEDDQQFCCDACRDGANNQETVCTCDHEKCGH